jgi:hypothetical protein
MWWWSRQLSSLPDKRKVSGSPPTVRDLSQGGKILAPHDCKDLGNSWVDSELRLEDTAFKFVGFGVQGYHDRRYDT